MITRANTRLLAASGGGIGASPITLSAFAATTGNAIVVFIRDQAGFGFSPTSVTDTAGNTYNLLTSDTGGDPHVWVYVAVNITGHASNVISIAYSGGANYTAIAAVEYAGVSSSPVDVSGTNTGGSTTDVVTSSLSTAQAGEVLIVFAAYNNLITFTAGTDFTLIDGNIDSVQIGGIEEYITTGTLSSYTGHITASSNFATRYVSAWVAPKPAPAGPAGSPVYAYQQQ